MDSINDSQFDSRNLGSSGKSTITTLHTVVSKAEKALSVKEIALNFFLKYRRSFRLRYLSCHGNMKHQHEQYQTSSHHAYKKRNHFRAGKVVYCSMGNESLSSKRNPLITNVILSRPLNLRKLSEKRFRGCR